jgi:hypothetical protein
VRPTSSEGILARGVRVKQKRRITMAKTEKKKAHLVSKCMPEGKQWAHKGKGGKKKTKVLAKLTSK